MRRDVPLVFAVLIAVGLAWWWLSVPEAATPPPEPPAPVARPSPPRPEAARQRTYALPRPDAEPEPEPVAEPEPERSVRREVLLELVGAGDEALGNGWQLCVKPWMEARGDTEPPPIVMNLVVNDGRVSDLELLSPIELDPALITCFADAAWSADFPEDPDHRGEVRVQRTMGLRR